MSRHLNHIFGWTSDS